MKALLVSAAVLSLAVPGAAWAQSSSSGPHQAASPSNASQSGAISGNAMLTAKKLTQDLQNSGFKDVRVVAEAFVVQAKTKDGDPIVMTVGPHGMSAFEPTPNGTNTTGSTRPAGSMSGASTHSGSMGSGSQK